MILMTLIRRAARHLLPGGEGTSFIDSLDPRAGTPAPRYRKGKGKESGFLARQPRAGMTDRSLGRAPSFVVSGREGVRISTNIRHDSYDPHPARSAPPSPGGRRTSFIDSLDPRAGTPAPPIFSRNRPRITG